jgi:hypothetical protein
MFVANFRTKQNCGSNPVSPAQQVFRVKRLVPWGADKRKKAPEASGATRAREMRSSELHLPKIYLLSAMGLAPKSRRLLAAVRAARAAGRPETAAP